ncbi:hypothetical protein GCM10010252_26170 [Streptomyces aureoverticillatus]|nr:hypothetical protein GCM10010252_26170 [Streptomyces aureoverticillatus]
MVWPQVAERARLAAAEYVTAVTLRQLFRAVVSRISQTMAFGGLPAKVQQPGEQAPEAVSLHGGGRVSWNRHGHPANYLWRAPAYPRRPPPCADARSPDTAGRGWRDVPPGRASVHTVVVTLPLPGPGRLDVRSTRRAARREESAYA